MSEADIVRQTEFYLRQEVPLTFQEIPLLGRYVDLVGFDPLSGRLVMIEAKLTHWRRAIRQATPCRLCTDEVYIAMPEKFVHRVNRDALQQSGVGLLSVGAEVTVLVQPSTISLKVDRYAEVARSLLHRLGERPQEFVLQ